MRKPVAALAIFGCVFLALRFSVIVIIEEAPRLFGTPHSKGLWSQINADGEPQKDVISQEKYLRRLLYSKVKPFISTHDQTVELQHRVESVYFLLKQSFVSAEPLFSSLRAPPGL